ncbi:MAG: VOC family protein, partial [Bacillota bacterium]|nr:VOC family protein [Bacillota bacterium]
ICNKSKQNIDAGKDISWGFEVDSLDRTISLLKEKGYNIIGPFSPNPGVKFVYILDPNGMKIQLIQNQ